MGHDVEGAGVIVGERGGPKEGHLGAELDRDRGDLGIIRGDDDAGETVARARGLDGPGDHRLAAEGPDVLARDALAAAAGGDDGEVHAAGLLGQRRDDAVLLASVIAGYSGRLMACVVVGFGRGEVARLEAQPLVVGLRVHRDVVHVHADAGVAQRLEDLRRPGRAVARPG